MSGLPQHETLLRIAKRVIWFETPEKALTNRKRFIAYAMTYATFEDMQIIRQYIENEELRSVLADAPPGIIDPRSWAYWHVILGTYPPPPLPQRKFTTEVERIE